MNFFRQPVIIRGVNHSGTRALVKILEILGSDAGQINNIWYENKFFLDLHKNLINRISTKGWTDTIYDTDFLKGGYKDNFEFLDFINEKLSNELENYYNSPYENLWHWKCPSSVFFENTWNEIFPNAYNIVIERNPNNVARSLMRDKLINNYDDALEFHKTMSEKIFSITKKKMIKVRYENLENEIEKIIDFIPLNVTNEKLKAAISFTNKDSLIRLNKSLNYNIKNIYTQLKINLYKLKKYEI